MQAAGCQCAACVVAREAQTRIDCSIPDKRALGVRGRAPLGCRLRNATHKADAPMHRTEHQLRQSLASLIHEKRYDAIVVKEILARAGVARSTFYLHFGDKEALLLSCIQHTLATERDRLPRGGDVVDRLLGFSLSILQHVETQLERLPKGERQSSQPQVHRRLERVLLERVEADIRREQLLRTLPAMPPGLLAKYLVASFFVVMDGWLDHAFRATAREAHDLYRALVEPAVRAGSDAFQGRELHCIRQQ